ncbi:MAG TPA: peptidylprolyl isomerase [Nitrospira sp.]|nr:peptidylprolyl isomerase [Nitrospira sp.]
MKRMFLHVVVTVLSLGIVTSVWCQTAAAAPAPGKVATVNGVAISKLREDLLIKEQIQRGTRDSEQLHAAIRERMIETEILAQAANKKGLGKNPEIQAQLENQRSQALANAYLQDYAKNHPVSDAAAKAEYDKLRTQVGDKEYKARHILVPTEKDAKAIIGKLKSGAKFEELAKVSKDPGSRARGGDLGWKTPAAFVKPFAEAVVKLKKGQYTAAPVQTQFGWHVIRLDDVRPTKYPKFDDVKAGIKQRLQEQELQRMVADLRKKAKVE